MDILKLFVVLMVTTCCLNFDCDARMWRTANRGRRRFPINNVRAGMWNQNPARFNFLSMLGRHPGIGRGLHGTLARAFNYGVTTAKTTTTASQRQLETSAKPPRSPVKQTTEGHQQDDIAFIPLRGHQIPTTTNTPMPQPVNPTTISAQQPIYTTTTTPQPRQPPTPPAYSTSSQAAYHTTTTPQAIDVSTTTVLASTQPRTYSTHTTKSQHPPTVPTTYTTNPLPTVYPTTQAQQPPTVPTTYTTPPQPLVYSTTQAQQPPTVPTTYTTPPQPLAYSTTLAQQPPTVPTTYTTPPQPLVYSTTQAQQPPTVPTTYTTPPQPLVYSTTQAQQPPTVPTNYRTTQPPPPPPPTAPHYWSTAYNPTASPVTPPIPLTSSPAPPPSPPTPTVDPNRPLFPNPRTPSRSLSREKLIEIEMELQELFVANETLIPKMVELAFHDCSGTCDGCLDTAHRDNVGALDAYRISLDLHSSHSDDINLADYIALLSTWAVKAGVNQADCGSGAPCNITMPEFVIGRTQCDDINNPPTHSIPGGDDTHAPQFLKDMFGLDDGEMVALMGAHSLGRARKELSGFDGVWDNSEFKLDNGYYLGMSRVTDWQPELVRDNTTTQWRGAVGFFMMLHSDMILFKNFTVETVDSTLVPSCEFLECPLSNTEAIVRDYANRNTEFYRQFSAAFTKMITFTPAQLTTV